MGFRVISNMSIKTMLMYFDSFTTGKGLQSCCKQKTYSSFLFFFSFDFKTNLISSESPFLPESEPEPSA